MSKINSNSNIYAGSQSVTASQFESYMEPSKLSEMLKNMEGDSLDRPVKYTKPK